MSPVSGFPHQADQRAYRRRGSGERHAEAGAMVDMGTRDISVGHPEKLARESRKRSPKSNDSAATGAEAEIKLGIAERAAHEARLHDEAHAGGNPRPAGRFAVRCRSGPEQTWRMAWTPRARCGRPAVLPAESLGSGRHIGSCRTSAASLCSACRRKPARLDMTSPLHKKLRAHRRARARGQRICFGAVQK